MTSARELLRLLTFRVVAPEGERHALLLPVNDREGLDLALRVGGETQLMHLDEADLNKGPVELANEILGMLK